MMPPTKIRVLRYNRSEKLDYINWLIKETGLHQHVTEGAFSYLNTRADIDNGILANLSVLLEPAWVEAAKDAVKQDYDEEVEAVATQDSPFDAEMDYDSWTQKELQEECRQRGLTIRGTKAEVVLRLRRDDDGIVEQETEDETEAPSEEAAEEELDAPSDEEAVTEEVTDNDNSGETSNTDEEE